MTDATALKIPEMVSNAKQVAWAKDILDGPYRVMGRKAKFCEEMAAKYDAFASKHNTEGGGASERRKAEAYLAAQSRYAAEGSDLPDGIKASLIIDKRFGLSDIADNILRDEFVKHGFSPCDI